MNSFDLESTTVCNRSNSSTFKMRRHPSMLSQRSQKNLKITRLTVLQTKLHRLSKQKRWSHHTMRCLELKNLLNQIDLKRLDLALLKIMRRWQRSCLKPKRLLKVNKKPKTLQKDQHSGQLNKCLLEMSSR